MKLGVITSLWAYAERLSLVDSLERIAGLGLRHVDLLGFLHGDPHELSAAARKEIARCIAAHDLIPGSLVMLPPGNLASADEEEADRCQRYVKAGIDLIAELGGNQVLFNGGKRAFGVPHAETWTRAADFLAQAADHAQKTGVYITLEAEPYVYFLANDIGTTLEMLREVDHPHLLAAVDIGHMNLSREGPEALQEIEPWIGRVHLSENDGLLHANNILGTGSVDFRLYLEAMQASDVAAKAAARGVELTTVMELGVLGDEIPDPDAYARRSMQHVLSIAPFMTI